MSARINELESAIAHLQNDLEKMSSVIVAQSSEIDELRRSFSRIERKLDELVLDSNAQQNPDA